MNLSKLVIIPHEDIIHQVKYMRGQFFVIFFSLFEVLLLSFLLVVVVFVQQIIHQSYGGPKKLQFAAYGRLSLVFFNYGH